VDAKARSIVDIVNKGSALKIAVEPAITSKVDIITNLIITKKIRSLHFIVRIGDKS
jgi:hypothetical protein